MKQLISDSKQTTKIQKKKNENENFNKADKVYRLMR